MTRSFAVVAGALLALTLGSLAVLTTVSQAQSSRGALSATYLHGALHFSIPWDAPRNGEGDLTVEILDPEDHAVERLERKADVTAGRGFADQDFPLAHPLAMDDLAWHRLRYRFIYRGERTASLRGIKAISQLLRRPQVHVLSQQSYIAGEPAAVRLVVTESGSDTPVASGSTRVELLAPGRKAATLYAGAINPRGTTRAQFRFPAGLAGAFQLRYIVDTPLGEAEQTQNIRLEEKSSILLTTEKPVYQPGQTIHVRALALDRASHQATSDRKLTFEVEDSRGNKLFRVPTQTDAWGVASAEFALADEVNLGTWHLKALLEGANTAELALNVERYVLPKFKVAVELSGKDAKTRRGYRPGDRIAGTVRGNYFFGKAVNHAQVVVKAVAMDVALADVAKAEGTTDADGAFSFDLRLPGFLTGQAANHGAARVLIEATIKDNAGHAETQGQPVTVSESPLLVTAVPESGAMVTGLENQVFILASYPDGTPAQADLQIRGTGFSDRTARTDPSGIAVMKLARMEFASKIRIDAKDGDGNTASVPLELETRTGVEPVLLHTEHALYRAGEKVRMQVLSARSRGSAYVDVVKDGQTVATHDLDIVNGSAQLEFTATPAMAGTVELNAYVFGREGRPVGDRRMIFVQPADELRIETTSDAQVYKPGGEARVGFRVTNRRGEGVQAVLGLEVVDRAVFALAEKQPGFAKVFFYLEQETMKPRYEIHSIGLPALISESNTQQDLAARALFSARQMNGVNNASLDFGAGVAAATTAAYNERYRTRLHAQLIDALARADEPDGGTCGGPRVDARLSAMKLIDAWGTDLKISGVPSSPAYVYARSAGPDGKFDTADDLTDSLRGLFCRVGLRVEHTEGTPGTEIAGLVMDMTGIVVPRASIRVIENSTGRVHSLTADAEGRFRLTALPAGLLRVEVSSAGFQRGVKEFRLREGDRAILSVPLDIGSVSETIEVTSAAPLMMTENASTNGRLTLRSDAAPMAAKAAAKPADPATHVRSWFPESLYVRPAIVTDKDGRATVTIPIADNIATWRMAMLASTKQGALGSATSSLKVFQDFFTEMDLPVTLTQGDEVSIPVAIYNYSGSRGDVRLRLDNSDWYSLESDVPDKNVSVDSGRVGAAQFSISAKKIGKFRLTLKAEMSGGGKRADIVVREIEVVPNGREQSMVFNGRLDAAAQHDVNFPMTAIPGANTLFVRLYPGPLSQVMEGMDSLLRMPSGCFEQTSSSTYPNVLALAYMKRTKKATPEVSAKAEGFIAAGYQRLVTFEVPGGGFSWFGNAPANKILTSYGLMEFSDMSKVHDVDPKVIQRTQQWLADQQQPDGSWLPDSGGIAEGAINRFQSDVLRITSYVAWALKVTGYQGPAVDRARGFIESHTGGYRQTDAYTLAVLANFAADYAADKAFTDRAMRMLLDAKTEHGDQISWNAEQTGMYGGGTSAAVETTGLAVQALLKWGGAGAVATKAMNFIAAKKDSAGTWGTTQATIMALRALLLSTEKSGATPQGLVEVLLNGKPAARLELTADNNDLFHQFVFKGGRLEGNFIGNDRRNDRGNDVRRENRVELRFTGSGVPAYQVSGRYFTPWDEKPLNEPFSIEVTYDRTRLEQDQIATATATVRNRRATTANMVMVDLGIPPGFELLSEDLESWREKSTGEKSGRLEKFSVTPTQAILYFDSIAANQSLKLSFRLRAKYPVRARNFASRVYEYYDPAVNSAARPIQLEVRKR